MNVPLCALVGSPDDWHCDDPAEPEYDPLRTQQAMMACHHCALIDGCAPKALVEYSGVWGGQSASHHRRANPDHGLHGLQLDMLPDEVEGWTPELEEPPLLGGRHGWQPRDQAAVAAHVSCVGLRQGARDLGVARNTLTKWYRGYTLTEVV